MARTRRGRWLKLPKRTDGLTGGARVSKGPVTRTFQFGQAVVEIPATRTVVCDGVAIEDLEFWRERMMRTGKGPVTDSEIMRGTLIAFRKFFGAGDGEALSRSFGCGGSR